MDALGVANCAFFLPVEDAECRAPAIAAFGLVLFVDAEECRGRAVGAERFGDSMRAIDQVAFFAPLADAVVLADARASAILAHGPPATVVTDEVDVTLPAVVAAFAVLA